MSKLALITGASSGIGREFARIHAKTGGNLCLVARDERNLIEVKNELESEFKIKANYIVIDLSKQNAARNLYDKTKELGLEVDYLINNAGFGLRGKFDELPLDKQVNMINLNITAVTELSYLFLQDFKSKNEGKILNTSSTACFTPGPLQAVYYASKSYVTFLGDALTEELRDTNITVTSLLPGATDTSFGKVSGMDKTSMFKKMSSPTSVAQDGYGAMMKGDMQVISGLSFSQKVMMKLLPFLPKKMVLKEVRKQQEI
ncbi:MAG: short-subunit dehydrogenase [Francisella sp.]|jgi:short-subunit dehydrogenase